MNKFGKSLSALVLGVASCGGSEGYDPNDPFITWVRERGLNARRQITLEGKIVKTQPSVIAGVGGSGSNRFGVTHEFVYVALEDREGKIHTLIYPTSNFILEQDAIITYEPVNMSPPHIPSSKFFKYVLGNNAIDAVNNSDLPTEGVILRGGIEYK